MSEPKTPEPSLQQRRNRRLLALGAGVAVAGAACCAYWLLYGSHFISTDNAYTAAEVAPITPSVGGTVAEVRVTDTQSVRKGDILCSLDPIDARLAVAQATAELDRTLRRVQGVCANDVNLAAQVSAREAEFQRASAQLAAAQSDFERARLDLERRQALVGSGSVSGDELTRATNAFDAAKANLAGTRATVAQLQANVHSAVAAKEANRTLIRDTSAENNPEVVAARVRLEQAKVDLERTVVRAPLDGVIARRQVQVGERVQPGAPLMAVVPVQEIYVDANFKEGQLRAVRVGQPAQLRSDLYGKAVTYHGTVEGFAGGSGAAFSAIPAQNATGNWIKVVQRLPVRIRLNPGELRANPLKVGLSMEIEIDTRTGRGQAALVAGVAAPSGNVN
jgi:membrane fusion protein (multidrug efflux system)